MVSTINENWLNFPTPLNHWRLLQQADEAISSCRIQSATHKSVHTMNITCQHRLLFWLHVLRRLTSNPSRNVVMFGWRNVFKRFMEALATSTWEIKMIWMKSWNISLSTVIFLESMKNLHQKDFLYILANDFMNIMIYELQQLYWASDTLAVQETSASTPVLYVRYHFDGLLQERHNSSALAMELRLSCTNPSIWNSAGLRTYYQTLPTDQIEMPFGSELSFSRVKVAMKEYDWTKTENEL